MPPFLRGARLQYTASAREHCRIHPLLDGGLGCPRPTRCFSFFAIGRIGSAAKKPAGKLGLGIKKLETKVDESLFDQAPAPEPVITPKVVDPIGSAGSAGSTAPAGPSRFSYQTLNEVGMPARSLVSGCSHTIVTDRMA